MEQEEQYLKKHFVDLSRRAENKNMITYSNFLNLNEISILCQTTKELYCSFELFGGYEHAERKMAAFLSGLYPAQNESFGSGTLFSCTHAVEYPISAICISPLHPKFSESLTHRDVLGSLMGLGIKREMLGDIVFQDAKIIVLCTNSICSYLMDNCRQIRHTNVQCEEISIFDFTYEPSFLEKEGSVASFRLDTIIADVCKLTRSHAQKLISEGNAFINSQRILNNDYTCQNGDILSVRHYGKYIIETSDKTTRKRKMKYRYKIYS